MTMKRDQKINELTRQLPVSVVFPLYIRELLLSELVSMTEEQMDILLNILTEERKRLAAL